MFGTRIKNYLDANGIKYNFLAERIGVSQNSCSAMLNERRKITVEEYFLICKVLGVDATYFADHNHTEIRKDDHNEEML